MKLYVFRPNGHGPLSWFVVANSHDEAITEVQAEIDRRRTLAPGAQDWLSKHDYDGWDEGEYELETHGIGVVVSHAND